jgi:uncharacterized protein YaeQ
MPKYTFDLTRDGESRKLVLVRTTNESEQHLALKVLAYLLYFGERPTVEVGVGQHFKPDLVCVAGRDVTLWIDCGEISLHKLDKISTTNHRARIVIVKATRRAAETYRAQAEKKVRRPERITYIGFDAGFVDQFVAALTTRTELAAALDAEQKSLQVVINDVSLRTAIHRW